MKYYLLTITSIILFVASACSNEPRFKEAVVKGTITVSDSLTNGDQDYSNIQVTIVNRDSANAFTDTLYSEVTNKAGEFKGKVQFDEKRYYNLFLSREGVNLGSMGVILADNDTLTISAELPNIEASLDLQSIEHDAMKTFVRVDRSFQRISLFARSGAIPDSELVSEAKKWSDLYWEVYQTKKNTIASYLAAEKSVGLLKDLDPDLMMSRIDEALPEDYMISVALRLGKPYLASTKGFEAVSGYLDSLSAVAESETAKEVIFRDKIKMYFDSSKVQQAKSLLENYEKIYADNSASKKWARRIRYDLNYLAPGVTAPDFSFMTMEGETINNEALNGEVFILEISPLASVEYQNDYDRTLIIHEIYKNYGLQIFTVPLDQSELTVNAFFDDRRKVWSIAKIGTFDVQDIIQKFNVIKVPTRFLIDENGVLIRKYERDEFQDVIRGLNQAFSNTDSPN